MKRPGNINSTSSNEKTSKWKQKLGGNTEEKGQGLNNRKNLNY